MKKSRGPKMPGGTRPLAARGESDRTPPNENKGLSRGWRAITVFLLALLPRALSLDVFLTIDEVKWLTRSEQFLQALLRQDFSATYLSAHPGIINYWLILSGLLLRYLLQFGVTLEKAHWSQGLQEFAAAMLFGGTPNLDFLANGRLLFALVTSACVSVSYLLSKKLFSQRVAFLGAVLLALDPFHIAFSRLLVTDALVASFMTLSLLSFIIYLTHRREWRYVLFSGLTAGLAFLTKVPSLILVPSVGALVILNHVWERQNRPGRKGTGQLALALATWGLTAGLICVVLWPAMWVQPWGTIHQMWHGLTSKEVGGRLQFFRGELTDDPGFWFYWVVALFRLTPLTLLGLLFGASSLIGPKKPGTSERVARVTMLMTFALFFSLSITLEPTKFDRYLLPIFPVAEIIAATGLCALLEELGHRLRHSTNWLGRWARPGFASQAQWVTAGCLAALIVQALFTLPQHPYYLSFYNPLAGGPSWASKILLVGHGEGLDGAARYLNQKDNASELVVATAFRPGLAPFFKGETVDLRKIQPTDVWPWLRADYAVLNIWEIQREGSTQEISLFCSQKPEHVVKIKGIEYTRIYPNRKHILSQAPWPQHTVEGNLAGKALLLGYDLYEPPARAVESGGVLHFTAYWQCLEAMDTDYSIYVRLKDKAGHTWGQADDWPVKGLLPTLQWAPGMTIRDDYDVEILPGTPPGYYGVEVGMYSVDEKGTDLLGQWRDSQRTVQVMKPTAPPPLERLAIQYLLQVRLGSQIKLLGYDSAAQVVRPGDSIPLTLFWQAEQDVQEDDLVLLQLRGKGDKMWALYRDRPANGSYPTTQWSRGEVVRQQLEVLIPADVPAGPYHLVVALADAVGGQETEGVTLAGLTVEGRPRVFEAPPIQHPLTANLGNQVEFLGYDLHSSDIQAGDTLSLTLYWQALTEMDTSYTVFVHVLDPENKVWGQRDSLPGEGSLPTTGWLPGEVIADHYSLPIQPEAPPGQYVIEIGMYRAETGQRLPIIHQKGQVVDDRVLLEEVTLQR